MRLPLHISLLLQRFSYAFVFFALARLIFFVLNAGTFAPFGFLPILSTFFYGLLFDLSAIAYVNALFFLLSVLPLPHRNLNSYQASVKVLFIITNAIALLINLADAEYFKFSGKRTGMELFQADNEIGNLLGSYLKDYWYLLLIWFALIWFMWRFYPVSHRHEAENYTRRMYITYISLFVLMGGLWVVAARGGFYLKPVRPFDASRFVAAELIPLTINTPLQLFSTIGNKAVTIPSYFSKAEAEKLYPYFKSYPSERPFQKKNVVLLILESFGKEYVGYFNPGKGLTPFLDSLCNQSLVFTACFANGKKSIEALPSILSSMPSLLDVPFINSPYQSNALPGLGKILKAEGYSCAFFHGAKNGTMGFDGFVGASSFGTYHGLDEYEGDKSKDMSGPWGIDDEPYLQYVIRKAEEMPQPFCAAVFTLSSHHPYTIPATYRNLPKGTLPIHQSVAYTDLSLRKFFETISQKPWYKNTVFVITADHSAQNETKVYNTMAGKFAVPFLVFDPAVAQKNSIDKTCAHTDIVPTLLHHLGYTKPIPGFGTSALDTAEPGCALHYENGIYQIISLPWVLHFNGQQSTALFNYTEDPLLKTNLLKQVDESKKGELEKKLKAIIQNYDERLATNRLMKE